MNFIFAKQFCQWNLHEMCTPRYMHIFQYFILRAIRPYKIHINANDIEKTVLGNSKKQQKA